MKWSRDLGRVLVGSLVLIMAAAAWSGVTTASAGPSHPAPTASPATGVGPSVCSGGCGGTYAAENITAEVTGVPQFYTIGNKGACLTAPNDIADGCQVFVPVNLAFTQTSSIGWDIQDVPVEPAAHAYSFLEADGATGFTASYNVNECSLISPNNGCENSPTPSQFNQYNGPGVDTEPYYWTVGAGGAQTNFIPGCSGAPYGMIFGPNGAPYNASTTIALSYFCPQDDGGPADDGAGGNGSDWNYSAGGFDPCPANGTNDSECLNGTFGDLDLSDEASSVPCNGCETDITFSNVTLPFQPRDLNGDGIPDEALTLPVFLWNGSYTWSVNFTGLAPTVTGGAFDVGSGSGKTVHGALVLTHPVQFTETGLPSGDSWSVWVNGSAATTNGTSITLPEPNGSQPYFVLALAGGYAGVLQTTTGGQASTGGSFYGNLSVSGNTTVDLNFQKIDWKDAPLAFKATGLPKASTFCVYARPAGDPLPTQPDVPGNGIPGIAACSGGTSTAKFPSIPAQVTTPGGAVAMRGIVKVTHVAYLMAVKDNCGVCHGAPAGYLPQKPNGTVNVSGHPVTVKVPFTFHPSWANFSAAGLVGDHRWHGKIQPYAAGGKVIGMASGGGSSNHFVVVGLSNGTYNWSIDPIPGYTMVVGGVSTWNALLVVAGGNVTVSIKFVPVTYTVTFSETGLPPGTAWSVSIPSDPNINDPTHDWSSVTSTIPVTLPNGTAKFTVVPVPGYSSVAKPAAVAVHGAPTQVVVTFHAGKSGAGPLEGVLGLATLGAVAAGSVVPRSDPRRRAPTT